MSLFTWCVAVLLTQKCATWNSTGFEALKCVVHYLIDLVVIRSRASAGYSGWKLVGFYPKIRICMGGKSYLSEWISGTSCNIHWLRVTPPRRVTVVSVDHNIGKRGVADAPCVANNNSKSVSILLKNWRWETALYKHLMRTNSITIML